MNLLDKIIPTSQPTILNDPNIIMVEEFRQIQYDQIENFVNLCVDYVSKIGGNYLTRISTKIIDENKYHDIYGYSLSRIAVEIKDPSDPTKTKQCLNFSIPNLIDGAFYYLNGSYYSPSQYILDKPISIKKKSLKLFGLFNSITIYPKDKRAIFGGTNIPINYFLQFFFDLNNQTEFDLLDEYETKYKIPSTRYKPIDVTKYFAKLFNCDQDDKKINEIFENLFLDEYTKELYSVCYGIDKKTITLKEVIHKSITMSLSNNPISFIDLSHKRLVFIELILAPLFRKCGEIALRAIHGFKSDDFKISTDEIVKHYTTKLKNNFLYDLVNFYSGILTYKASFLNPGSDDTPSEIASVHDTHLGRLCNITISAQNPGEVSSLIPKLLINKHGLFVDDDGKIL